MVFVSPTRVSLSRAYFALPIFFMRLRRQFLGFARTKDCKDAVTLDKLKLNAHECCAASTKDTNYGLEYLLCSEINLYPSHSRCCN